MFKAQAGALEYLCLDLVGFDAIGIETPESRGISQLRKMDFPSL